MCKNYNKPLYWVIYNLTHIKNKFKIVVGKQTKICENIVNFYETS